MADILDAAQKQATTGSTAPGDTAAPPSPQKNEPPIPNLDDVLPGASDPVVVPEQPESLQQTEPGDTAAKDASPISPPSVPPASSAPLPEKQKDATLPADMHEKPAEILSPSETLEEPPPLTPPPSMKKRHGHRGVVVAALLFLLLTLPLAVYFVAQQRQLAEIRSNASAQPGVYPGTTPGSNTMEQQSCYNNCLYSSNGSPTGNTPVECASYCGGYNTNYGTTPTPSPVSCAPGEVPSKCPGYNFDVCLNQFSGECPAPPTSNCQQCLQSGNTPIECARYCNIVVNTPPPPTPPSCGLGETRSDCPGYPMGVCLNSFFGVCPQPPGTTTATTPPPSTSCQEGQIQCNDTGGVNYCSSGRWWSRPANIGVECPASVKNCGLGEVPAKCPGYKYDVCVNQFSGDCPPAPKPTWVPGTAECTSYCGQAGNDASQCNVLCNPTKPQYNWKPGDPNCMQECVASGNGASECQKYLCDPAHTTPTPAFIRGTANCQQQCVAAGNGSGECTSLCGPLPVGYIQNGNPCDNSTQCSSGLCEGTKGVCWPVPTIMPDTCTGPKPTCSAGTEPTCVLNYWHCAVTFVTPTPPPQGVVPQVSQNGCTVTNNTDQSVRVCAFSGGCEGDFSGRCGPSWNQINNEQGGAKCINLTAHGNTNLCQPATVQCGSWQTDISIANNPDGTAAVAGINTSGCTSTPPGGGNPPGTTPPGGNPPGTTPPTGGGPQCTNIKIYKDGAQVTPSTLRPGDNILIAVAGTGATKAHIRVNGADWIETTTTNSNNEFTVPFTIPSGVTNFTIEAEIYVSGVWQ